MYSNVTSEQIIGGYAVRYSTLKSMINDYYSGSNATSINLFIDVGDILYKLFKAKINFVAESVISSIINLCAHYRNFFREYYKTDTKIYLIDSCIDDDSLNSKFINNYGKSRRLTDTIENSIRVKIIGMLKVLIDYLPDVYFMETNYEFGVIVMYIIHNCIPKTDFSPSLILTKDSYNFQLAGLSDTDCSILRPKKYKGNDVSLFVDKNKSILAYCEDIGCPRVHYLNSGMLPILMTMTRVPNRNIKGIYNVPTAIGILEKLINNSIILNDYTEDMNWLCKCIEQCRDIKNKINNPQLMVDRFKAISLIYQYRIYINDPVTKNLNTCTNLSDPKGLQELNQTIFKDYPLDLNVL